MTGFFIAYPSVERAAADELYAALRRDDARVFLDHECLRPGDLWPPLLSAALRDARVVVVLVSAASNQAYYQREEVITALALRRSDPDRRRVVPVYLDDDADPPYGLRQIHQLSVTTGGGIDGVARALLR